MHLLTYSVLNYFYHYILCGMKWRHSLEIPINLLMNVFSKICKIHLKHKLRIIFQGEYVYLYIINSLGVQQGIYIYHWLCYRSIVEQFGIGTIIGMSV